MYFYIYIFISQRIKMMEIINFFRSISKETTKRWKFFDKRQFGTDDVQSGEKMQTTTKLKKNLIRWSHSQQ